MERKIYKKKWQMSSILNWLWLPTFLFVGYLEGKHLNKITKKFILRRCHIHFPVETKFDFPLYIYFFVIVYLQVQTLFSAYTWNSVYPMMTLSDSCVLSMIVL